MSPQGCLSAFFLGLILAWSLFVGAFIVAGWLGAEIVELLAALFFADVDGARRASEGLLQFLRAIGFGMFAAIWALGVAVLALLWFAALRGARQAPADRQDLRIDIQVIDVPPERELKDITPGRDDGGRPPGILPPR